MVAAFLLLLLPAVAATPMCRTPLECGVTNLCGSTDTLPLGRGEPATVCIGFKSSEVSAEYGRKALFQVTVDRYATLSSTHCAS